MKKVSNVKRILAMLSALALMCGMLLTGAVIPAAAENENAEVKTFDVDFADLAALVDEDKFDATSGLYQSTADDTAINEWVNARFGVFVNREGSMYQPKAYLGQPSFSVINFESGWSDNWGGEINLKITNDGALHHTSTKVGDQQLRKSHTLTVKNPQGDFAELANFEAEMVFNQAGTSPIGSFFISFHEQTPGQMWRNNNTFVGTSGNEAVIIGYLNSSTPSGNGIIVGNIATTNTKTGYTPFEEALSKTDDYKLTVKVVGTALTATVTKVADGTVVYTGSNTIAAGSGSLSFGLGNSAKNLKSVKVTALDENGNPVDFGTTRSMQQFNWTISKKAWYKNKYYYKDSATQATQNYYNFVNGDVLDNSESARSIYNALCSQFDAYHNKEGNYNVSALGQKQNFEGQAKDFMWFRTSYIDAWMQMTSASLGGNEMMRQIHSLSPKGADGEKFFFKNFETTFRVRFNDSSNISAFTFGFRQDDAGRFLNNYYNINKEQGLLVIDSKGYNFAAGDQIVNSSSDATKDMYKYTLTPFETALTNGTMLKVTVRVVGDQATLKIINQGTNGTGTTVLVEETKTIPHTAAGYLAYGVANKSGDLGDISLTHLDDNGNKMSLYEHTAAEYDSLAVGRDISFTNIPGAEFANNKYTANNAGWSNFSKFDASVLETVLGDVQMVYNNGAEYTVRSAVLSGKGTWLLYNNRWLQLGSSPSGGANRMTNINALIPLDEGAAAQKVTDSTTRFVVRTEGSTNTILLGLRQDVPGKFMISDTEINKNQVLVAITPNSIKVAGGNDINYADFALGYTEEEGTKVWGEYETALTNAVFTNAHLVVEATLIGNTLKLHLYTEKVNSTASKEIYEGTFTVNYGEAGYTAVALANGGGNVADISVEKIGEDGYRVDYPNCEHVYDAPCDQFCNKCGGNKVAVGDHDYAKYEFDAEGHWGICSCGATSEVEAHALETKAENNERWSECACGYATGKSLDWDYDYTMLSNDKVYTWPLDNYFDAYNFASPKNGSALVEGPAKASSVWDSKYNGTLNNYVLKAHKYGDWALLTYKVATMKDFKMEITITESYTRLGVIFGATNPGVFPISADNNPANDTGVILAYESRQFRAAGAIAKDTADHNDLPKMNVAALTVRESALGTLGKDVADDSLHTYCIEVKDGVLTMWVVGEEELVKSVELSDKYTGGYVSVFSASNGSGFSSIKIEKISDADEHTCDFATKRFDAESHWDGCACGEKANEEAHTLEYVVDGDGHYAKCACGYKSATEEHTYATTEYDENGHWTVCACGVTTEAEAHVFDDEADETCDCGYTRHVHTCDYATPKYDADNHWNECSCGEKADVAAHVFESDCDTTCDCGYTRTITHNYATTEYDDNGHWTKCACGATTEVVPHEFDSACDTDCACGYTREITHNYATTEYDDNGHWTKCACGETTEVVPHVFENDCDTTCDCGYTRTITHNYATTEYDDNGHWTKCACGATTEVVPHEFDGACDTDCACGYTREITHNYATPKFDADNHWNECECGEKADVTAHTMNVKFNEEGHWTACDCGYATAMNAHEMRYVVDGDQHYEACACGYETEKVGHTYEDDMCACGDQKANTAVVDEAKNTIIIKAEAGYQLKAGTLLVEDAEGNLYVPTRVGFRDNGDADEYELPAGVVGPFTVHAEFYQPTMDDLNMAILGTQTTETLGGGLRFVHRLNVAKDNGVLTMMVDGQEKEVATYGILIAANAVVKNPEKLTIKVAEESMHVHQFAFPETNKYFDVCADYADIAVHVTNIEGSNAGNVGIITRTYVEFADGTVVYGAPFVRSYNEVK